MKNLLFFVFVLLSISSSCKNEDPQHPVYAGVFDSGFHYYEFDPSFTLAIKPDSSNQYNYGTDSLDLDWDGTFDMITSLRYYIEGIDSLTDVENTYPFCKITIINGFEVAIKTESFPIGLGQSSHVNWVDTLAFESRIDTLEDWSGSQREIWMWVVPPTSFWGSNGTWFNPVQSVKYIGIRKKLNAEYKYGWIRVLSHSRINFEIPDCSIEI